MTSPITVPARERGRVRVFSLSMSDTEAKALKTAHDALLRTIGSETPLDMDHVELFALKDLEGIGLMGYLNEGAGVPEADLVPDRCKLEQLEGWILVVFSLAFEDRAATLQPAPSVTLVGTYSETRTDVTSQQTLTSDAAEPYSAPTETPKKRPSDAAMSGRVATLVLIVLALFTYAFIRIAG